jgi:hypothetical protein
MEIVIGGTIIYKNNNIICIAKRGYEPDDKEDVIMFNLNDATSDRIRRIITSMESNHQTFDIEYFVCDSNEEDEILSKGLDFNNVALFDAYYNDLISHINKHRDELTFIAIKITFDDLKDIEYAHRSFDFKYSIRKKSTDDENNQKVTAVLEIIYSPIDGVKIGRYKMPNFRLAYAYVTNIFSKEIEGRIISKITIRGMTVTIQELPDYLNMYMDIMFSY